MEDKKEHECCGGKGDDCCKNNEEKKDDCGCGHEHSEEHKHGQKYSIEDITYNNHFVLNTLVGLLIEKKVISEEEFENALQKVAEHQHKE